ncbi:MAG: CTP synthase [Candidatus Micrarchaeaceae archaeon]
MQTKYIVVLGSLLSGLGKGIVTSSIAKILSFYGYKALPMKFDGYLNYDCGTMNPYRHGEVFVLDDKSEVDMDFGNYERFLNLNLSGDFSLTGGKVFSSIIEKERRGEFLGRDVQFIPHVTDFIVSKVEEVSQKHALDVMLIEVGGTVGDIENSYFIEAMRQLALKHKTVFVDVTYVPMLSAVGEQKTKPTQLALRSMMQMGIMPNVIICRSEGPLGEEAKAKISNFANIPEENVFDDHDMLSVYELPLHLIDQKFDKKMLALLGMANSIDRRKEAVWREKTEKINSALSSSQKPNAKKVRISIVGKYMGLRDSYVSLREALLHASAENNVGIDINWVESELLESMDPAQLLGGSDGIIVPGGFGGRGIEGMINAIKYARTNRIPYLGLCLGMQLMAVEFARNVCGLNGANSEEFDRDAKYKVIKLMEDQRTIKYKGGTMRLGSWPAKLKRGTNSYKAYRKGTITERHRHRYEFNNAYRKILQKGGLVVSATTPNNLLVEMIEWKGQFGIGTQAHPELKSRPEAPSPIFVSFLRTAAARMGSARAQKQP